MEKSFGEFFRVLVDFLFLIVKINFVMAFLIREEIFLTKNLPFLAGQQSECILIYIVWLYLTFLFLFY